MKRNVIAIPKGPAAREPHGAPAAHRPPLAAASEARHRARGQLRRSVGVSCMAAGWVLAVAGAAIMPAGHMAQALAAPTALLVVAAAVIAFGVGWTVRDEGHGQGGNWGLRPHRAGQLQEMETRPKEMEDD